MTVRNALGTEKDIASLNGHLWKHFSLWLLARPNSCWDLNFMDICDLQGNDLMNFVESCELKDDELMSNHIKD